VVLGFILFLSIALGVYASFNALLLDLNLKWIPRDLVWLRRSLIILAVLSAGAFIAARVVERITVNRFTAFLSVWGSLWLGFLLYNLLWVALASLGFGLASTAFAVTPELRAGGIMGALALTLASLFWGWRNARRTSVRELEIAIPKKGPRERLRVVMASDIHMGSLIGRRRMERFAALVNGLSPDLVLIAGDAIDEDLAPVLRQNTGEALKSLRAPLGVWACTGNHEYIGGAEPAVRYLEAHGVRVLRDAWVDVGGLIVAGREDASSARFGGSRRKSLGEVLRGVDPKLPILLMDHQPSGLHQAQQAGVDLQVSGHTHHGQMWPLSLITRLLFELSYGYLKKGDTHYYVSCGYGTWGPPVRLGSRSEVAVLNLTFAG
jgi:hypothetical protein